ncbi:choice-of-anchor A family protein [uncultured Desulfobacter sp.]|uniref:choice-of-anchor A family protein n=1 Tax=uncultured Desulfobacter sp. TaxID=240139 RepID=UPI0029F56ACE|nr:choice-of-anchor A family protein [uncultured Desulfobacter sp.]
MKKRSQMILAIACMVLAAAGSASATLSIPLGAAGEYNLFTISDAGNVNLVNSDSQGSVAIGGNATLSNYKVGSNLGSNGKLVVNGNLTWTNGEVGQGNGIIYAKTATLSGVTPDHIAPIADSGVDFGAAAAYLTANSAYWGSLAATGETENNWGDISLTGDNADLNIFNIIGSDLLGAHTLNINVTDGATVLINVTGSTSGLTNMGYTLSGVDSAHILYNFFEAKDLDFYSVGIQGSVLAPQADVDFYSGNIDGQMVAYTLDDGGTGTTGQFHNKSFAGSLSPVPIPGTAWLLSIGMLWISALIRKKA